jgi:predicted Zn-dependent peptidase
MEFGEDMDFYRRYLDVIQSITAQQLLDLAQEYLNEEEMWLVMAGK